MMEGYAGLLRDAKVGVRTIDVPDEDHFSVLARVGDPRAELHRTVLEVVRP
jgi:hypothetical protein